MTSAPNLDWKHPFKNAKKLLLGRGVQGIVSLVYTALAAKGLGAEGFGILTLFHVTVLTLRNIAGFRSWQLIMTYGAQALVKSDVLQMRRLLSFSAAIEVSAAIVCVALVYTFAGVLAGMFSIPAEYVGLFQLYSFTLIFLLCSDVGLGVLRLFDRHDMVSWQLIFEPFIRMVGVLVLYFTGAPLYDYIILWFIAGVLSKIILIIFSAKVLKIELKKYSQDIPITKRRFKLFDIYKEPQPGVWRYALGTSVQSALAANYAPMFVATVLGPVGAGLWRIAQRFAGALSQPVSKLLVPVIYTDMSWLNASNRGQDTVAMMLKAGALVGSINAVLVAVLYFTGEWLIQYTVGLDYLGAFNAMLILACGTILSAFSFGLAPMLITAGKIWSTTVIKAIAMVVFFVTITPLVSYMGVAGAAVATLMNVGISVILMAILAYYHLKQPVKQDVAP